MKILRITAEHIKNGVYIGGESVEQFDGHIEIAAKLGIVCFAAALRATGSIVAKEMRVECGRLESGTVAFGELVETGGAA